MKDFQSEIDLKALDGLDECVASHLRSTARVVTQYYDQALSPIGLRITQTSILVTVAKHQPATIGELAEALGLDHSTLVRNLKRLEEMKLLSTQHGIDRRTRTVMLSERGARKVKEMVPLWREAQQKLVKKLGIDRWQNQIDTLGEIRGFADVS